MDKDYRWIRQGLCAWYDTTGLPFHETVYLDNKEYGKDNRYYKSGQLEITGNYKAGKMDGDFIGYYPSGKISGKAKFVDGKQVSGNFYNEDGSVNSQITDFIKDSEYPGGTQEWSAFLNKHVRYPKSAIRNRAEGTVVVQFIISEEGTIANAVVIRSVDPDLNAEAVRVIYKSSGKWPPAIYGGRFVKSYKMQPIVFSLQVQ